MSSAIPVSLPASTSSFTSLTGECTPIPSLGDNLLQTFSPQIIVVATKEKAQETTQSTEPWWQNEPCSFPSVLAESTKFNFNAKTAQVYPNTVESGSNGRESQQQRLGAIAAFRQKIQAAQGWDHPLWSMLAPVSKDVLASFGLVLTEQQQQDYRVDKAGNVLYRLAEADSLMGWDLDHCFPWSLGGLTRADNLHPLQSKANRVVKNERCWHSIAVSNLAVGMSEVQFVSSFNSGFFGISRARWSFRFVEIKDEKTDKSIDFIKSEADQAKQHLSDKTIPIWFPGFSSWNLSPTVRRNRFKTFFTKIVPGCGDLQTLSQLKKAVTTETSNGDYQQQYQEIIAAAEATALTQAQ